MTIRLDFAYNPQTGRIVSDNTGGGGYSLNDDPYFTNFLTANQIDGTSLVAALPGDLKISGGIGGIVTGIADALGVPEWVVVAVAAVSVFYAFEAVT